MKPLNDPALSTSPFASPAPAAERVRSVLVVEDEDDIRDLVGHHLRKNGYAVSYAGDGRAAWDRLIAERPALVVLDLMLPGLDGLSLLALMRKTQALKSTRAIILSARGDEEDVLRGLERGAVDYMTKPFNVKELVARVKAVLRRAGDQTDDDVIEHAPLRIEPAGHRATLDREPLELTSMEFALLHALASQPLRVLSRAQLLGQDDSRETAGRSIDVHIRSLRKKLGAHDRFIDTVRGVGYRFVPRAAE